MTETAKEAAGRFAAPVLAKGYRAEGLFRYTDREGKPIFYRIRAKHPETADKWIRPMYENGQGWELREPNCPDGKPLYRLHKLLANPEKPVYWVEGEQKADALAKLGFIATTAGSCTSDESADFSPLAGRDVVIWPDHDEPGHQHGDRVAEKLRALNCQGEVLDVSSLGLQKHGDAVDWLRAHPDATAADIEALAVLKALVALPKPKAPEMSTLNEAALHGLPGEIVRTIEPHTESDPAALLIQLLVAFGSLVGRGPHYRVEGDQHHANLFAVLVGKTSKGRKGTSWGRVHQIFKRIPDCPKVVSGLSSGEGLKYHVRDELEKSTTDKHGKSTMEIVNSGVTDKRLLVKESEFAQVLKQASRPGNTLSATVREAWDSGHLVNLTKNDPIEATGAHVAIIGHITQDELKRELTSTERGNGFANRFLFIFTQRTKLLPFGGDMPEKHIALFAQRIENAAAKARTRTQLAMTEPARVVWERVYAKLSEDRDGLFGAVTGRSEAQVVRLALVYALFDSAKAIDAPHLLAALALWEYCDESAAFIFGTSLGDSVADELLRAFKESSAGMTRTEIRRLKSNHISAERLDAALDLLERKELVTREKRQTGGAPVELWTAMSAQKAQNAQQAPLDALNALIAHVR